MPGHETRASCKEPLPRSEDARRERSCSGSRRGSSLLILPPRQQSRASLMRMSPEPESAERRAERPASVGGNRRSFDPSRLARHTLEKASYVDPVLQDRFVAKHQRPATAPSAVLAEKGPGATTSSRRPSVCSKEIGGRRPSVAKRVAEDVLCKDASRVTLKSAAILAHGTDYICSNFSVAGGTTPSGRKLLRSNSLPTLRDNKALGKPGVESEEASEEQKVLNLAHALNLPKDLMTTAYDLFKRHADMSPGKTSFVKSGRLTRDGLKGVLRELTGRTNSQHMPPEMVNTAFQRARHDSGGALDFSEFAVWFSSRSFFEDFNLDANQRSLRMLARKYDMPYTEIERYKKSFDEFDIDHSGYIAKAEFQHLLLKLSKVPEHIGVPSKRVQQLWSGADADKGGHLDFQEFLAFYRKYFDTRGGGGAGFEDYYRSVRRPCMLVHS